MRALLLLAVLALAGCTAQPRADEAQPAPAAPPPAATEDAASLAANGTAANATANATFPAQEHDLAYAYYATADGTGTGNMNDATWQVDVPPGATQVRAAANVSSAARVNDFALMIHLGTLGAHGKMLAGAFGPAGALATDLTNIPPGERTLLVMCHPDPTNATAPVAAAAMVAAHLRVEFR